MFTLLKTDKVVTTTQEVTKDIMTGNTTALEKLWDNATNWCIDMGKSIIIAVIIFIVGRFLIKVITKLLAKMMQRRNVDKSIQSFLNSFVGITLTILLIISVISALGVNTTSFAALLASAGVAVGMALSGNLQNFAGGLIILLLKPYKVGDIIEAQGTAGVVKEIQIFHTVLTTADGKEVYLPNGSMSSGSITNWQKSDKIRVQWTIGIEYGEDTEKARRVLLEIISKNEMILSTPAPSVDLGELAASSVNLIVRVWVENKNYWPVFFGVQEDIYKTFNREGINFPFPQLDVHNKA